MTLAEIILMLVGIVGAGICGHKKKYAFMFGFIVLATAMFILLALTLILVLGID